MSPEQQDQASDIDARSDIWSLGAVLYELFAGYPPFDQESFRASLSRVLGDDPPRLGEVRPDLPLGIALAIERCLESDRDCRPRDVAELAIHLEPYAEHELVDEAERIRRRLGDFTFAR
jgi:serine/threonine-protein kinase